MTTAQMNSSLSSRTRTVGKLSMSSFREAHTPKKLEAELKKCDGSIESTIGMYERQANQALKEGNKALYENYMCIVKDLKSLRSKSVGKLIFSNNIR